VNTWDERKRRRNLKDHGIDFADLQEFFDGDLLTREDTREAYGEARYQSVGVFNGVPLFVVWTSRDDEDEETHLISARKAEKHEYQAWLARYAKRYRQNGLGKTQGHARYSNQVHEGCASHCTRGLG
jgi:uncharacterized DUF497 family protein